MGVKKPKAGGKSFKQTNRKLNKLARKGKLRRKTKEKLKAIRQEKSKEHDKKLEFIESDWADYKSVMRSNDVDGDSDAEPLPDDMIDDDVDGPELANLPTSLLKLEKHESSRKRVFQDTDDLGRQFIDPEHGKKKVKMLLPIKDSTGALKQQFMELPDVKLEDELVEDAKVEEKVDIFKDMTAAEILAERQKIIRETKRKIASHCNLILQDPQGNIFRVKELLALSLGKELEGIVRDNIKKLATVSLTQVLIDIIPSYKIKIRTQDEMKAKLKKETRALVDYEESLLRYYEKFIKHLQSVAMNRKERENDTLCGIAVKCLCKLLVKQAYFNHANEIIEFLVKFTADTSDETCIAEICCALTDIIENDKLGEVCLRCVRSINRTVKDRVNRVKPCLLEVILHLNIKEVNTKTGYDETKTEKRKSKLIALSKKDKKYAKQLGKLENELKEAKAFEDKNTVLRLNTQIMEQVFLMYFRFLRKTAKPRLLPPVLEGLSQFAHLINIDLFDELLGAIHALIAEKNLNLLDSLHCIHTAMVILSGEGHVLTVDPCKFYKQLYALIPKIMLEQRADVRDKQFVLTLKCLDMMINKRRKQVSKHRVTAFVKRLILFALILPANMQIAIFLAVRSYFLSHTYLTNLTESEVHGSGKYMPALNDPDHCNAVCTHICMELDILKKSASVDVSRIAHHLASGLPSTGQYKLPLKMTEKTADQFYVQRSDDQYTPVLKELIKQWSHVPDLKSVLLSLKPTNN